MQISILTLFPEMFSGPFNFSIIKRAQAKNLVRISYINIRQYATDKYQTVDDKPYGGGVGMVMKVDVIDRALQSVLTTSQIPRDQTLIILLDPKGQLLTQSRLRELRTYKHVVLICGHYEGVDARVTELVDESITIGEYVLTGGELAAMVITDSVVRLLSGVLPSTATENESFTTEALEAPQYTRPEEYKGMKVPPVLLSGNHRQIQAWKAQNSFKK
jgi:tRNA (guanine37-N1)-methyltransferase